MLFAWLYRLRRIRAPGSAALPRGAAAALLTVAVASASTWGGCNHLGVDPDDTDSDPEQTTLAFADPGTLELKPTQVVDIEILTDGSENVTLLLLGDALDASLQDAVVRSSSKGRAIATLTAPSQPTAFVVRAQIASEAFVELHVAVSEQGFTTLRIVPKYDGKRSLDGWSADVVVAGQCDTLLATYPEDPVGALHVEANKQVPLELGSVPVGPQLALAVHSGSLVAGCVNFAATKPGDTEEIEVVVLDRPMALGDAELEILLELAPDPEAYGTLIEESGKVVADVAFPPQQQLSPLILDTIGLMLTPVAAQSLAGLRESGELDATVATSLGDFNANAYCKTIASSAAGLASIGAQSGGSTVEGLLVGAPDQPAVPAFQLVSFGGLSATQLGAPQTIPFAWDATADDVLVISGLLPVSTTRLAGAFMSAALSEQLGVETLVAEGVRGSIDCALIASDIVAYGEVAGCDAQCLEQACDAAIGIRWDLGVAAGDSLDGSIGSLQIAISGDAEVDTELRPVDLQGGWLGTLAAPDAEASITGDAEGHAPPPR